MYQKKLFHYLCTLFVLFFFFCIPSTVAAKSYTPHVKILDSKDISWDILQHRMERYELLVEKQLSRVTSLKNGGSGVILNDSKKNVSTRYYGQISGLRIGDYVTTYYIYNPYSDQWDDAILWYSLVTKKPSQANFRVLSSSSISKSLLKKRQETHQIILEKKTQSLKKGKKKILSVSYSLYNPDNHKINDRIDICEYRFINGKWKLY